MAVTRGELRDRPIAAEHHSLEAEAVDGVGDAGRDLRVRPVGVVGFGDHAGNLAPDVGQPGGRAQLAPPRFAKTLPDVGFGDVIDNEIHLRTAPSEFVHFAKLRMKQTKVEGEPKFRQQPDAGKKILAESPIRLVMVALDQPPNTASERQFRVLDELRFDRSALLERQ